MTINLIPAKEEQGPLRWFKVTLAFADGKGQADTMHSRTSVDAMIGSLTSFKFSDDKRKIVAVGVQPCAKPANFPT